MEAHKKGNYGRLALMTLLHFGTMYLLMYAMVDSLDQVVANANQLYMAGLMTAPMLLIEVTLMRGMYPSARYNALILAFSAILLVDDSSALGRHPDVSRKHAARPGDQGTVHRDHRVAEARDCRNAIVCSPC